MDIDTGNHPPITQKPYTVPLKHTQWVHEELEMLKKNSNYFSKCFWSNPIVILPKKAQTGKLPQKHLYFK